MPVQNEHPNHYSLKGSGITILYETIGIVAPVLNYGDGTQTLTFRGGEIRTVETELGALISATLKEEPDADRVTMSLLLPDVNLPAGKPQAIRTAVILCIVASPIGGPDLVRGQIQKYRVVTLRGTASVL